MTAAEYAARCAAVEAELDAVRAELYPHTSNTPPRVEAEDAVSAETRPGRDSARPAAVGGGSDE